MNDSFAKQVREEGAKRDRMWDPRKRWEAAQATITWAEKTVQRNTRRRCLEEQARKLGLREPPA
jgi:hypothetical protein